MARTFTPKVGKHVTYWAAVTRKPRPGTITAVVNSTTVSIRMPRNAAGSAQTVASKLKRVNHNDVDVWSPA